MLLLSAKSTNCVDKSGILSEKIHFALLCVPPVDVLSDVLGKNPNNFAAPLLIESLFQINVISFKKLDCELT